MATPSTRETPLTFTGTPSRLECIAILERAPAARASVALALGTALGEHRSSLHLLKVRGSQSVRMRFTLPPLTPAGSYRGSVQVDDHEIPIVVNVHPRPGLTIAPSSLFIEVSPGGEATASVTLLNRGNVACGIGKAFVFRLFSNNGYDQALAAALKDDKEHGRARIDRFIDEFVAASGGNVRVSVERGSGAIQPGEQREVILRLKFPDSLTPNSGYYGYITLQNLHFCVNVNVAAREERVPR